MKRYINVADLYGILNEMDMLETYNDFMAVQWAINNTPTADVSEVKHGHIIERQGREDNYYCECSVCKTHEISLDDKYCRECGAQMDGENNDL